MPYNDNEDTEIERTSISTVQVISWIVGISAVAGLLAWGWIFYAIGQIHDELAAKIESHYVDNQRRISNLESGTTTPMSHEAASRFEALTRDYDDRFHSLSKRVDELHDDITDLQRRTEHDEARATYDSLHGKRQ